MRQFVAVRFGGSEREYTYHNDGTPVAEGDTVIVEVRGREQTAKVCRVDGGEPPFTTKAILGRTL